MNAPHSPSSRIKGLLAVSLATVTAAVALCGMSSTPALSATRTVTKADDTNDGTCDSDCSLREAIAVANNGDTILFDNDYTIHLNSTLNMTETLTIDGGSHTVVVSGDTGGNGSPDVRVFDISASGVVTLSHLAIVSGTTPTHGGGVRNAGTLVVAYSILSGNSGIRGGAIYNDTGTLTVTHTILSGNTASYGGGGIFNEEMGEGVARSRLTVQNSTFLTNTANYGGALFNGEWALLAVQNSTLSGNVAHTDGGGIQNDLLGSLTMQNCTLSGNVAEESGGGISHLGLGLQLRNTLIANSIHGDCSGSDVSVDDHNWLETAGCSIAASGDPGLGPLQDNGDAGWTHRLFAGSGPVDAGNDATCLSTDQRGVARPQDGDGDGSSACDIGAYEGETPPVYVVKTATPTSAAYHGTITYTISLSSTGVVSGVRVYLTDTLPAQVDFGSWSVQPAGAAVDSDVVAWSGIITHGTRTALAFTVVHIGDYGDVVLNTADVFSGAVQTSRVPAAFNVICGSTFTVQNANDSGTGSLRQAIASVCPGGTITFAGNYTIYLNSTLNITKTLTIHGSSHTVTVSGDTGGNGSPDVRVFSIGAGGTITLSHLHIVSGTADFGGGVRISMGGRLVIQDSNLSGNTADYSGGGIDNSDGTLTVQNSTLSGNIAENYGGGIYNSGSLTILNSTLSGNRTYYEAGGGIYNSGSLTILNGTLSENEAGFGSGGIYNAGTLYLRNTLIANSVGDDCYGYDASINDHNWLETAGCGISASGDPGLGSLQDHGGASWTHALLAGSGAIDAGNDATCLGADQRGVMRPQDGDGDGNAICDIGAYESEALPSFLIKTVTPMTSVAYHGTVTYTLLISSTGSVTDMTVLLTDTLPTPVVFGSWIVSPTNTVRSGRAITWTGIVTSGARITLAFTAIHNGNYGDIVANTAWFSSATQAGSARAVFTVQPYRVLLPLVLRKSG